jgi:hypothetical protein
MLWVEQRLVSLGDSTDSHLVIFATQSAGSSVNPGDLTTAYWLHQREAAENSSEARLEIMKTWSPPKFG